VNAPTPARLAEIAADHAPTLGPGCRLAVPVSTALLADHLTPVAAYRRLVAPDERTAASFLFESVEGGERAARYSILSSEPAIEVTAHAGLVRIAVHRPVLSGAGAELAPLAAGEVRELDCPEPLDLLRRLASELRLVVDGSATPPGVGLLAGWVGYAGYDAVRYAEPAKLPFATAPPDDRGLPDVAFALYDSVVVFDTATKLCHVVALATLDDPAAADAAHERAARAIERRVAALGTGASALPTGRVPPPAEPAPAASNLTPERHGAMVRRAREFIHAGDAFQVVLGQRFEHQSPADPFDVYRALRTVNPSPYMVYLQAPGVILVASSPEILCRVRGRAGGGAVVTNRPLAGTRPRGATPEEDRALERELLADAKELAEHAMLVDLGRNDVGKVARAGTVSVDRLMEVERYSHVMHISSTITAQLRDGMDAYDALAAALPAGTISGAPKVRAMQIIDTLEPVRRGPYGGGVGWIGLPTASDASLPARVRDMDLALTLRTIVCPTSCHQPGGAWTYHVQASGGIVADSREDAEHQETVNKAAALARAIDLAGRAFVGPATHA